MYLHAFVKEREARDGGKIVRQTIKKWVRLRDRETEMEWKW